MKTYKPLWLDAAPPRKPSPAFAKKMDGGPVPENRNDAEGDSQPDYPVAPPVSLPLSPFIPPVFPHSGGGGHGR